MMGAMEIDFRGKRALVTGAGKGIGREIAALLGELGARVTALSRTAEDLETLRAETGCSTIVADLSDAREARRAAERAGDADLLVNNAGISIPQPFLETTVDAFDATMAVNVRAILVVTQVIARGMIARDGGAIVNLSSQASMRGLADHASYCAAKGALDQLTRVMALELGPHDIRVNAVNPTVTLTPMADLVWSDPAKRDPMMARIPRGRFARPLDVAHAVAWLLSDLADMVHGAVVPVDGGFTAV